MASGSRPKRLHQVARCLAVAATAAVAVGLAPGTGQAAPDQPGTGPAPPGTASVADVQRQVAKLGQDLEAVTEQYNGANVALTGRRAQQHAAQAQVAALAARIQSLSGKVRQRASSAYRTTPVSEFTALLTSDSPKNALDRLSALDVVASRQQRTLDDLGEAKVAADAANQAAADAADAAKKLVDDLAAKKRWIEQQLPVHQALLDRLTAQQRQQALDGGSGNRASRGGGREAPTTSAPDVPASGRAKIAVDAALSKLGSPYVWAAEGPDTFDCSGLTKWAWAKAGVDLPHQSAMQFDLGPRVGRDQLQPGDLVFFYSPVSHVGMYIGNGQMVHAPQPGDVVKISGIDSSPWAGATRPG